MLLIVVNDKYFIIIYDWLFKKKKNFFALGENLINFDRLNLAEKQIQF